MPTLSASFLKVSGTLSGGPLPTSSGDRTGDPGEVIEQMTAPETGFLEVVGAMADDAQLGLALTFWERLSGDTSPVWNP